MEMIDKHGTHTTESHIVIIVINEISFLILLFRFQGDSLHSQKPSATPLLRKLVRNSRRINQIVIWIQLFISLLLDGLMYSIWFSPSSFHSYYPEFTLVAKCWFWLLGGSHVLLFLNFFRKKSSCNVLNRCGSGGMGPALDEIDKCW